MKTIENLPKKKRRNVPFYLAESLYKKLLDCKHQHSSSDTASMASIIRGILKDYHGGDHITIADYKKRKKRVAALLGQAEMDALYELARNLSLKESRIVSYGEVLRRAIAEHFSKA